VAKGFEEGTASFGTIESWVTYALTGGANGGSHVTDSTNASRTMMMDLEKREWDEELMSHFGVPHSALPRIVTSAEEVEKTEP